MFQNWKDVLRSIVIGACVAFISSLVEGLADFLKSHSTELIAGGVSASHYLAGKLRV